MLFHCVSELLFHLSIHLLGTNLFSSQKGMNIGAQRHVGDIKVSELCKESHTLLTLQSGWFDCGYILTASKIIINYQYVVWQFISNTNYILLYNPALFYFAPLVNYNGTANNSLVLEHATHNDNIVNRKF